MKLIAQDSKPTEHVAPVVAPEVWCFLATHPGITLVREIYEATTRNMINLISQPTWESLGPNPTFIRAVEGIPMDMQRRFCEIYEGDWRNHHEFEPHDERLEAAAHGDYNQHAETHEETRAELVTA